MRITLIALALALAAPSLMADSYAIPPSILKITMTAVKGNVEYTFGGKTNDRTEVERHLVQLKKLMPKEQWTVIQIDFGKGDSDVTASEFFSLLELLETNGFTNVSINKPTRVGMALCRLPVLIEPAPSKKK